MSSTENFFYRLFFKLKIYEASGDQFQQTFSRVMYYSNNGFQSITPWGNWGDGGNDGWIESDGHYFQVYGPQPGTGNSAAATAAKKAINDFQKLPEKWEDISKYTFVMNDYFKGVPAPIASELQKLKKAESLDQASVMSTYDLLTIFMTLKSDEKQEILGTIIPEVDIDFVDTDAIGALLGYLTSTKNNGLSFLDEEAPDFEHKIVVNNLSSMIATRLRSNSYHASVVDEFLAYDPSLEQDISMEIREIYSLSKTEIPDDRDDAPNLRYIWMIEEITNRVGSVHEHTKIALRSAAEIILAKYFETCDAYEHPDTAITA